MLSKSFKINSHNIKSWPLEDRPREKLIKNGEQSLSNAELLAILLKNGTKGENALELARKIILKFQTLRSLCNASNAEFREFKGLGIAKIAQLKAAIEIGKRIMEENVKLPETKIFSAKKVFEILLPRMKGLKKEVFKIILLNSQKKMIEITEVTEGTTNYANPIIREIFEKALKNFASSIICAHNHPSGDPTPSKEDKLFTHKLVNAGYTLEIQVIDHVIIGDNTYFSFLEQGKLLLPH
jgi:DNA repair protein RadC